jgi:hypothetical protein
MGVYVLSERYHVSLSRHRDSGIGCFFEILQSGALWLCQASWSIDRRLKELGREYFTSGEDPRIRNPEIVDEISVVCNRRRLWLRKDESSYT